MLGPAVGDGQASRPPTPGRGRTRGRLAWILRVAEVRLRIPIVLVACAVVLGRWDDLRNRWDRLTRRTPSESIAGHAISADTEYFCPMDPGVRSDWPGRCGVCNMVLVRRRRGDSAILPDGVVARMQLSPYRVQLAGIRTAPADFRPLSREWKGMGRVARRNDAASITVDVPVRQAPWLDRATAAEVTCPDLAGRQPIVGRLCATARDTGDGIGIWRAEVAVDRPPLELRDGMIATVRLRTAVADLEPFRSMPRNPPPLSGVEPRRMFVCADHPDSTALEAGRCPVDGKEREPVLLGDGERVRWWCPMHPGVTAEKAGARCGECGGMELRPRRIVHAPAGQVLAIPQSAVVDTGSRRVVYVEGMPGLFDGVEVTLGPRCGDLYPVVRGIEPGARIAIAGAFLLDAETRLNPSLASGYFGATGGERPAIAAPTLPTTAQSAAAPASPLDGLAAGDRRMAEQQRTCPVTGQPLGSMGAPDRQVVAGQVVFLCCSGCRAKLLAEPSKYVAKLSRPR